MVSGILDHLLEFIKTFDAMDTLNLKGMPAEDAMPADRDLTGGFAVTHSD